MNSTRQEKLLALLNTNAFVEADKFQSDNILQDSGWVNTYANKATTIQDWTRNIQFMETPCAMEIERLWASAPILGNHRITANGLVWNFTVNYDTSD